MEIQPLLLTRPLYVLAPVRRQTGAAAPNQTEGTAAPEVPKPTREPDEVDFSPEAEKILGDLSDEETQQVEKLKARDREVRTHEQAHLAAAGPYARGGPTYTYQQGPDGQRYAIGGEVQIDTSPVPGDPEATIAKARVVRNAALAPAEPSSQDRAVAAAASQMEQQARAEQLKKNDSGDSSAVDSATEGEASESGSEANGRPDTKQQPEVNQSSTSRPAPVLAGSQANDEAADGSSQSAQSAGQIETTQQTASTAPRTSTQPTASAALEAFLKQPAALLDVTV